jgi:hypothetical protein
MQSEGSDDRETETIRVEDAAPRRMWSSYQDKRPFLSLFYLWEMCLQQSMTEVLLGSLTFEWHKLLFSCVLILRELIWSFRIRPKSRRGWPVRVPFWIHSPTLLQYSAWTLIHSLTRNNYTLRERIMQ